MNERARQEIKAREREHRREGLTARTDHDRHDRRDRGSDRDRGSEDRRREQRRDGDRGRDDRSDGRDRDSRGDRQRNDWERDRRSSGRGDDRGRGSERPPSERRGGSSWEESTPLRSAPQDEWEETPARAGGRSGSTAPSPNPYWQRGGSTPLIRAGTSSRGPVDLSLALDGLLLRINAVDLVLKCLHSSPHGHQSVTPQLAHLCSYWTSLI